MDASISHKNYAKLTMQLNIFSSCWYNCKNRVKFPKPGIQQQLILIYFAV